MHAPSNPTQTSAMFFSGSLAIPYRNSKRNIVVFFKDQTRGLNGPMPNRDLYKLDQPQFKYGVEHVFPQFNALSIYN